MDGWTGEGTGGRSDGAGMGWGAEDDEDAPPLAWLIFPSFHRAASARDPRGVRTRARSEGALRGTRSAPSALRPRVCSAAARGRARAGADGGARPGPRGHGGRLPAAADPGGAGRGLAGTRMRPRLPRRGTGSGAGAGSSGRGRSGPSRARRTPGGAESLQMPGSPSSGHCAPDRDP